MFKKNFRIFDATLYSGKPDFTPYGIEEMIVIYSQFLWPGQVLTNDLPSDSYLISQLNTYDTSLPWCLDIEHFDLVGTDEDAEENRQKLVRVANLAQGINLQNFIGYYGVMPIREYFGSIADKSSAEYLQWAYHNTRMDLGDSVDVLMPSLYTFYDDEPNWHLYAERNIEQARLRGKPIYVFLWPQYHESNTTIGLDFIDRDFWRLQLEYLYRIADGIILWGGYDFSLPGPLLWDESAGWWVETKRFLNSIRRRTLNAMNFDFTLGNANGFTYTRLGTQDVVDFDGVTKTIPENTPGVQGARVVHNIIPEPNADNYWDVEGTNPPISGGPTTHLGEVVRQTLTFDPTMTATGYSGCRANSENARGVFTTSVGRVYRYSLDICLSRRLEVGEQINIFVTGSPAASDIVINQDDDYEDWTRIATTTHTITTSSSNSRFVVYLNQSINTEPVTVYIKNQLAEDVTGQTNQNPSSFVEFLEYYNYRNGNTVSGNEVTEAQGITIADIEGILLESPVSMSRTFSVQANNFEVGLVAVMQFSHDDLRGVTDIPLMSLDDGTSSNSFDVTIDATTDQIHLTKTVSSGTPVTISTTTNDLLYSSGDTLNITVTSTSYGMFLKVNALDAVASVTGDSSSSWTTLLTNMTLEPASVAMTSVSQGPSVGSGKSSNRLINSPIR